MQYAGLYTLPSDMLSNGQQKEEKFNSKPLFYYSIYLMASYLPQM